MKKIRVRLGERSYDILIGRSLIGNCGAILKKLKPGTDAIVITNPKVSALYGKVVKRALIRSGFTVRFEMISDSEKAKSLVSAGALLNSISRYDVNRRIFIIALGGGVVGDLAGFVASVYKRGVPDVQIPTTLLAQVDSSVGGKVAVDLAVAKNLVGAFYQPRAVIADIDTLKTLSPRQVRCGLAEIIKYGVIKDKVLFCYLEANCNKILKLDRVALERVVANSCRIKADIVALDEYDKKRVRAVLNFGHTIGHAIEAAAGYSGRYDHGEAVALGMLVASKISSDLGLLNKSGSGRIENLIKAAGLPVSIDGVAVEKIYEAHLHDKKFLGGKNRFILVKKIGLTKIVDGVGEAVVRNALNGYIPN